MSPPTNVVELQRLAPAGLSLPRALWDDLAAAYESPAPRAYHSLVHVVAVAQHHAEVARVVGWRRPQDSYLAVLFHDAVYVAGANDNERRSAAMVQAAIDTYLTDGDVDAERIASLIELTARHGSFAASDVDDEAALFLDCDMAILGADAEVFDAYARAVRDEYREVPDDAYRAGRTTFLLRVLAAPAIFLSPYFSARLEDLARENIARELKVITRG